MLISKTYDKDNKKLQFLVIEDDEVTQRLMTILLPSLFTCEIHFASTGEEGVIAASYYLFDLILTDIDLPSINGITTAKIIRNQEGGKNNHTPIIAISGNIREKQSGFEVGIDAFLAKPFTTEELKATLKQFGFLLKPT